MRRRQAGGAIGASLAASSQVLPTGRGRTGRWDIGGPGPRPSDRLRRQRLRASVSRVRTRPARPSAENWQTTDNGQLTTIPNPVNGPPLAPPLPERHSMATTKKKQVDAITLLKTDHKKVRALLETLDQTKAAARRTKLLGQIEIEVKAHARIEEEIFYPAFKAKAEESDQLETYYEAKEE